MKRLRSLLTLFVLVAAVYVGWKVVPPYFAKYQFEDVINTEARLNAYSQKSEQEIRDIIYRQAAELEIPIRPEQIIVSRTGDDLRISAEYSVHVDLPVHPLELNFNLTSKGKRI